MWQQQHFTSTLTTTASEKLGKCKGIKQTIPTIIEIAQISF